jgi:UDP-N-acetylmuramyl tripeptide synthase
VSHARDPLRARLALTTGHAAVGLSRLLRVGSGSMIGGRLALRVDPEVLHAVTGDRRTVLVTGTNGKSTVTALVVAAVSPAGPVVSNTTGANMTDGVVTALAADRHSPLAVIECDEVYLGPVARGTRPAVVVALNVSREYTRGVSLRSTLEHWRRTAAALPQDCVAVVNVDDPLVTWAFEPAPRRIGVSGGLYWREDAHVCPACGSELDFSADTWSCPGCGRSRPEPEWAVVPDADGWAVGHAGERFPVEVTVPGRTGPVGAAFALAVADLLGVELGGAIERLRAVADVDGRYAPHRLGEHTARLLLLKNSAGWAEAVDVVVSTDARLVVVVDRFGPKDAAMLWEAPFHRLAGREVVVTGSRRVEALAVLDASGVRAREAPDVESAVALHEPGEVVVGCNYPAFRRLSKHFRGGTR